MSEVIDLRNNYAQTAADNIAKIINAKAAADKSQTDLQKELMLDQITRHRNLLDQKAQQQQQFDAFSQFANQQTGTNPGTPSGVSSETPGVANSQTAAGISSPMSPIGGAMPARGYTPQQPPPMSMADGSNQAQIQQMQAQAQAPAPLPAQVQTQIEKEFGTKLPKIPKYEPVGMGNMGKPVLRPNPNALTPQGQAYNAIIDKNNAGIPLSEGEMDLVRQVSGMTKSQGMQNQLEKVYADRLDKVTNARSGGVGLMDSKVNQALLARQLLDQYYDPATKQYNVPTAQYTDLAISLATLLAPSSQASDSKIDQIKQRTAAGDFNGVLQYVTGSPKNATTSDMIQNLADSIDREGLQAEKLRDKYLANFRAQAPKNLNPETRARLEAASLPNSFRDYLNQPISERLNQVPGGGVNGAQGTGGQVGQYKEGDIRTNPKTGISYKRDADGNWHSQ